MQKKLLFGYNYHFNPQTTLDAEYLMAFAEVSLCLILMKGLLAFGSVCEAETEIIMYVAKVPVKTGSIRIPRAPRPKPQVAVQNGMICIKSISTIENAYVSIVSDNDSIVTEEYMNLSPTKTYIPISLLEIRRTYILKIEYGETLLYGYIYL